jgi:hypothetical protein
MQHEPCGLLGYAKVTVNLVGANSVLAANQHPESGEPFLQRDRGILEDGFDFDGELAATGATLPPFLSLEIIGIQGIPAHAIGASRAIGPAHHGDGINANLFVAKVLNCLL